MDESHLQDQAAASSGTSFSLKRVLGLLTGAIGIIASTGAVVGMVQGWFTPDASLADIAAQQQEISQKLNTQVEDNQLVNQVSRRVTELGDQYGRISKRVKDIRRLAKALASRNPQGMILTPGQRKVLAASLAKEREELLTSIAEVETMSAQFIAAIEGDETLGQVAVEGSEAARTKARAQKQAAAIKGTILPELAALKQQHGG